MLPLQFDPFPLLTTERLLLRRITQADTEALFAMRSDPRIMQYIDRPLARSASEVGELIAKIEEAVQTNSGITWAISLKENPELIGTIGYWRIIREHYRAEIGYMLHPAHQQKGIMNEALTAVISHGFDRMKLHSIEGNVNPLNLSSIRLLENKGFVREAYFRENHFYEGRFFDSAIYSLVNTADRAADR